MANFVKFQAHSVGRLFLHNNRVQGDGVEHSNESIDDERTMFNYHLKKGTPEDVGKRLSEIFYLQRKNQTVLGEMVVTLPKDVKKEDERNFFTAVYDFYCQDFGEKNIINAVVHKDENTPHIHIDFVPVVTGKYNPESRGVKELEEWKKEHGEIIERLCCKELITRDYLGKMHERLSKFIDQQLGYHVSVLNGATAEGNKTILELRLKTLQEEIAESEKISKHLHDEIIQMHSLARQWGIGENDIGLIPLMYRIDDLETQNRVLQQIISRNSYKYTKQDLEQMRKKKFTPAKSVCVNVCDGSLTRASIDRNAIVIIEVGDRVQRPSPQQEMIDNDNELTVMTRQIGRQATEKVLMKNSKTSEKIYLFLKVDDRQQTVQRLLMMEEMLMKLKEQGQLEGRRLYMDRMETDVYDVARSILLNHHIQTLYYARRDLQDKAEEKEAELNKS